MILMSIPRAENRRMDLECRARVKGALQLLIDRYG